MMRCLIALALVALTVAEPPVSGPYPPSGWRPSGPAFDLPSKPSQEYGQPSQQYPFSSQQFDRSLQQNGGWNGQYVPPNNSPSNQYTPSQQNKSPTQQNGSPSQHNASQQYGPPEQQYGPPNQQYGPPDQQYGSPDQEQGPLDQQYGPPDQQNGQPDQQYGPPDQQYGPPDQQSNPPSSAAPEPDVEVTTLPSVSTVRSARLQVKKPKKSERLQREKGVYYVYHPTGQLQKVTFTTRNDLQKMAYTADLKYENVEPIRDPVYTYDPETLVLRPFNVLV